MIIKNLSQLKLKSLRAPASLRSRSPSPLLPLISHRREDSQIHSVQKTPFLPNRCQTPGAAISKADSKGRPKSTKRSSNLLSKPRKITKKFTKKSKKLLINNFGQLFIEKLISIPISDRKKESSSKVLPRACYTRKQETYDLHNKPKETMTETLEYDSFIHFYSTEPTERVMSSNNE